MIDNKLNVVMNDCCKKWLKYLVWGKLSCPDCGEWIIVSVKDDGCKQEVRDDERP